MVRELQKILGRLLIVVFAAFWATGGASDFYEVKVPDRYHTITYLNGAINSYRIPRDTLNRQVHCSVIFPNGVLYSLWPDFNITEPTISVPRGGMDHGCTIGFQNPPPVFSGTYELISLVTRSDNSELLVTRKYHMTFVWDWE